MKKLLIGLCALLASTATMAAGANKMTMVTYFPVKYVAYSQVDVTKQMDIGLTSACQMNLGCATDEGFNTGKSLRVNNLLKIAGGKLELNDAPAIVGSTAIIGSGNGTADFDFETNLRVRNYKQGYTLQADNMYLSELNLFGYKFPACSGETMSWQKLKLKNKDEVYLVCGKAEKTPFNGCQACSSYDEDSTEYENCVLNNVTSCCYYADKIYTKRGQNAFELMKNTSCYTCGELQNGMDHTNVNVVMKVSELVYTWGKVEQYYLNRDIMSDNIQEKIDCMDRGYLADQTSKRVTFYKCPSDGTCGGKGECATEAFFSNCTAFDHVNENGFYYPRTYNCRLQVATRLCTYQCVKNW